MFALNSSNESRSVFYPPADVAAKDNRSMDNSLVPLESSMLGAQAREQILRTQMNVGNDLLIH